MAATLSFAGIAYQGTPLAGAVFSLPDPGLIHHRFAGLSGTYELAGGVGGRPISVPFVIHGVGLTTSAALVAYLEFLESQTGAAGTLVFSGDFARTVTDCTFLGFEQQSSPVKDISGLLAGSWFLFGAMHFFERSVL